MSTSKKSTPPITPPINKIMSTPKNKSKPETRINALSLHPEPDSTTNQPRIMASPGHQAKFPEKGEKPKKPEKYVPYNHGYEQVQTGSRTSYRRIPNHQFPIRETPRNQIPSHAADSLDSGMVASVFSHDNNNSFNQKRPTTGRAVKRQAVELGFGDKDKQHWYENYDFQRTDPLETKKLMRQTVNVFASKVGGLQHAIGAANARSESLKVDLDFAKKDNDKYLQKIEELQATINNQDIEYKQLQVYYDEKHDYAYDLETMNRKLRNKKNPEIPNQIQVYEEKFEKEAADKTKYKQLYEKMKEDMKKNVYKANKEAKDLRDKNKRLKVEVESLEENCKKLRLDQEKFEKEAADTSKKDQALIEANARVRSLETSYEIYRDNAERKFECQNNVLREEHLKFEKEAADNKDLKATLDWRNEQLKDAREDRDAWKSSYQRLLKDDKLRKRKALEVENEAYKKSKDSKQKKSKKSKKSKNEEKTYDSEFDDDRSKNEYSAIEEDAEKRGTFSFRSVEKDLKSCG